MRLIRILAASIVAILVAHFLFGQSEGGGITWFKGSLAQALDSSASSDSLVMLFFDSDFGPHSRDFRNDTLNDPEVIAALGDVVCMSLKVEADRTALFKEHSVDSVPTCIFFRSTGREVARFVGYRPPGRFLALLALVKGPGGAATPLVAQAQSDAYVTAVADILAESVAKEQTGEVAALEPARKVAPTAGAEAPKATTRTGQLYEEGLRFLRIGKGEEALHNFLEVVQLDPSNREGCLDRASFQILGIQVHDTIVKFTRLRKTVRGEFYDPAETEVVSDAVRPAFKDPSIAAFLQEAGNLAAPFMQGTFQGTAEERDEAVTRIEQLRSLLYHSLASQFEAFLNKYPETRMTAAVLENLQSLYFRSGDAESGARVSEELIKLRADKPIDLARYARNLAICNFRLERARELGEAAYALQPENPVVLDTLALVECKLGNLERAIQLEQEASRLCPEIPAFQKRLDTYRKMSEDKGAGLLEEVPEETM